MHNRACGYELINPQLLLCSCEYTRKDCGLLLNINTSDTRKKEKDQINHNEESFCSRCPLWAKDGSNDKVDLSLIDILWIRSDAFQAIYISHTRYPLAMSTSRFENAVTDRVDTYSKASFW